MSKIYFVHAATSVGRVVVKAASHATIDEALGEAAVALSAGSAFAWIVDGEGNLVLPPDQVKVRLDQSARAQ
jgi:hypothetical protein